MMNRVFVSVVIPSFNREQTIKRAIESVLHQTYDYLEVIVVDDCSNDNTEQVVKSINDSRVRYIKLETNSGACVARNVGVENSRGTIIAFQDSDDCWKTNKLEVQLEYMERNNLDFCSTAFTKITPSQKIDMATTAIPKEKSLIWCELLNHNWVSTQTIICKKECFNKIHFDPTIRRYQDWDLALQASIHFTMGHMCESTVDVFLQSDSITNTVKNDEAMIAVIEKHFDDVSTRVMLAQYYKSLADVQRNRNIFLAAKNYRNSFFMQPKIKTIVCYVLCVTGLIKLYKNRQ